NLSATLGIIKINFPLSYLATANLELLYLVTRSIGLWSKKENDNGNEILSELRYEVLQGDCRRRVRLFREG
ncbi:hypothetical protein, partial [Bacteroides xylanisolvens]|uniref:hypothetical protein n=1 Tax=Bacteroides xylanisolvens TaxID=371601 RepID=UPI0019604298